MQHQQVGDASVLIEGQAQGWFGLTTRLGVAVGMPVNSIDTIDVAVYTIDTVGNGISCKHKYRSDKSTHKQTKTPQELRHVRATTFLLLLLLLVLLQFLLLLQVNVGRLHPDN